MTGGVWVVILIFMEVHPVINCATIACFRKRANTAAKFLKKGDWIHVDIGKKPFTPKNNAVCVKTLKRYAAQQTKVRPSQTKVKPSVQHSLNFEAHLMSEWNRRSFLAYLRMPFERIYIHQTKDLLWALEQAKKYGKELGVVVEAWKNEARLPQTEAKLPFSCILVLAVKPGDSGQTFNPSALKTISFLKKKFGNVTITVDGGITPTTLRVISKVGASATTSGSYIWKSENPSMAYKTLRNIK